MESYIKDLIRIELQKQNCELQKRIDELQKQNIELKERIDEIEDKYQKQLEKIIGDGHTRTKHGFTDVITDDAIDEIKEWEDYVLHSLIKLEKIDVKKL